MPQTTPPYERRRCPGCDTIMVRWYTQDTVKKRRGSRRGPVQRRFTPRGYVCKKCLTCRAELVLVGQG